MTLMKLDGYTKMAINDETGELHYLRDGKDLGKIDFGLTTNKPEPDKETRFTFNKNDLGSQIINPELAGKIGAR